MGQIVTVFLLLLVPGASPDLPVQFRANQICLEMTPEFDFPLDSAVLETEFVRPLTDYGVGHRGVDLVFNPISPPAHEGVEVLASGDGVISYIGEAAGVPLVSIKHADQIKTTYQPVAAFPELRVGDPVSKLQPIGILQPYPSGSGHCGPVACLHFGMILEQPDSPNPFYLDPLLIVKKIRHISLKPVM